MPLSQEEMRKLFSKRLSEMMQRENINQVELSRIIGVSESTVGKWILCKSMPRMGIIQKLADHFHVGKSYFLEETSKDSSPTGRGVRIPVLGRVVAGIPIEAVEEILDYEEITPELAATGEFFALQVKGDSMLPKLEEGDIVIVKKQEDVETGDIAIVLVNGDEATIKQVKKVEGGIMLYGFNPDVYEPHFYSNRQIESLPVRILGKVIESRRSWK
jgi:repressor LexA